MSSCFHNSAAANYRQPVKSNLKLTRLRSISTLALYLSPTTTTRTHIRAFSQNIWPFLPLHPTYQPINSIRCHFLYINQQVVLIFPEIVYFFCFLCSRHRVIPGVKRPGRGLDHHIASRLKREQSYTTNPPRSFMACSSANFTVTFATTQHINITMLYVMPTALSVCTTNHYLRLLVQL